VTATTIWTPFAEADARLRAAAEATDGRLAMVPAGPLTQVAVRADAADRAITAPLMRRLGAALPTEPNTWVQAARAQLIWLGPDEWLAVAPAGVPLVAAMTSALAEGRDAATVVDVSDQRSGIDLSGPAATDLLASGCAIDLHPRVFVPGCCAQTPVGRVGAIVLARRPCDGWPAYRLLVASSYALALADWLVDAAQELRQSTQR
jgi:sarcosine oxidase subunit gamma